MKKRKRRKESRTLKAMKTRTGLGLDQGPGLDRDLNQGNGNCTFLLIPYFLVEVGADERRRVKLNNETVHSRHLCVIMAILSYHRCLIFQHHPKFVHQLKMTY